MSGVVVSQLGLLFFCLDLHLKSQGVQFLVKKTKISSFL